MKHDKNDKWLDPLLSQHIHREPAKFDFEKWAMKHPEEARLLRRGFKDSARSTKTKPSEIWRFIMESKVTRYSAAAVIILAMALVLLSPFGTSGNGNVALADVQEKVKQIDTMILRGKKIFSLAAEPNISFEFDVVKYISKQYGYTEKGYFNNTLVYRITLNRPQSQTLIVLPIWKKCLMFPCTDEQIKIMEKLTPHGLVDLFQQTDYKETGRSHIDGVEVDGFEVKGVKSFENFLPKFFFDIQNGSFNIWIGVKELLPIRMEGDIILGESLGTIFTEGILHEISVLEDYDIELDKSLFDCNLPEGYTEFTLSDILPFIPVKAKAGLAGLCILPAGFIIWRRRRKRAATYTR